MNLGWFIVYTSSALEVVIGCTFQRILISLYIGFVLAGEIPRSVEFQLGVFTICQITRLRESSMHRVNGICAYFLQPIS